MRKLMLVVTVLCTAWSCDIFEETDISGKFIDIIGPADGASVEGESVGFSWKPMDGAEKYRITVAYPDFASGAITADTLLVNDSVTVHSRWGIRLSSGNYQWRITAANEYYHAVPVTRRFTVTIHEEEKTEPEKEES